MEITVIASRKGGVGKTATALALGAGLRQKGYSVLFIDLDSQRNLSDGLQEETEEGINSLQVLTGEATALEAIRHTPQGDIITASEDLAIADAIIIGYGKEYRLKRALKAVQDRYDHIIIDTPAALGILTVNALTAANDAIIPLQADIDSLKGLTQLSKTINMVRGHSNRNLKINGLLITRFQRRTNISRDNKKNIEAAAEFLNTWVYTSPIRECTAIKEAKDRQQDIFSYAPKSNAAKDYTAFLNEYLERK